MAPSRNSIRLLAERGEAAKGGGSPPPVPASMARPQASSSSCAVELDSDMINDLLLLADMLSGKYLDVQADAAAAVAGLTTDGEERDCCLLMPGVVFGFSFVGCGEFFSAGFPCAYHNFSPLVDHGRSCHPHTLVFALFIPIQRLTSCT